MTWFYPYRSVRRFATEAEARAYERGEGDFRTGLSLPADPPPLTPERQAYREGWYAAEKRELDNTPDER